MQNRGLLSMNTFFRGVSGCIFGLDCKGFSTLLDCTRKMKMGKVKEKVQQTEELLETLVAEGKLSRECLYAAVTQMRRSRNGGKFQGVIHIYNGSESVTYAITGIGKKHVAMKLISLLRFLDTGDTFHPQEIKKALTLMSKLRNSEADPAFQGSNFLVYIEPIGVYYE